MKRAGEGAVHSAHRQRGAEGLAPALPCRIGKQGGKGPGRDQVLHGQPATVVEDKVRGRHAGGDEELSNHARAFEQRSIRALQLAQGSEGDFGVEVLADFVGHDQVIAQRRRDMRGQQIRPRICRLNVLAK